MFKHIKFLFALGNVLLIVSAVVFLVFPRYESLQVLRADIEISQRRYYDRQRLAALYEENLQIIENIGGETPHRRDEFALLLSEISIRARLNNLRQLSFAASEPYVHYDSQLNRVYEIRVSAEYEGGSDYVVNFLQGLDMVDIVNLTVDFHEFGNVRANLEFVIIAVE